MIGDENWCLKSATRDQGLVTLKSSSGSGKDQRQRGFHCSPKTVVQIWVVQTCSRRADRVDKALAVCGDVVVFPGLLPVSSFVGRSADRFAVTVQTVLPRRVALCSD